MNELIGRKLLGRDATGEERRHPRRYANTSSAGSIIAFHRTRTTCQAGELG